MSDASKPNFRNKRIRWALAGLIAGLSLLFVLLKESGATLPGIAHSLNSVGLLVYAFIIITQSLIVIIAAVKWRIVLAEALNFETIPLGAAASATATGALLGQIISIQISVPIVRAWTARKYGISAHAAAGTSLFEQSLELLTLGLVALAGLALMGFGAIFATTILLALLVFGIPTIKPTLRFTARLVRLIGQSVGIGSLLTVLADGLDQAAQQSPTILHKLIGLSFMRYALIAVLNIGIMMVLLPGLDPLPLFVSFPLILLLTSVPFLPAGLGVTEVTWASVLLMQGIDPATAAEAAVSLRIITIGGFLLAYPVLLSMGRNKHKTS